MTKRSSHHRTVAPTKTTEVSERAKELLHIHVKPVLVHKEVSSRGDKELWYRPSVQVTTREGGLLTMFTVKVKGEVVYSGVDVSEAVKIFDKVT